MKSVPALVVSLVLVSLVVATPVHAQGGLVQGWWQGVQDAFQELYYSLPGEKPGRGVIQEMAEAMPEVESAASSLNISGGAETAPLGETDDATEAGASTIAFQASGPVAGNIFQGKISEANWMVNSQVISPEGSWQSQLQVRKVGDSWYYLLEEAPELEGVSLQGITDQWFESEQLLLPLGMFVPQTDATTLTAEEQSQMQDALRQLIMDAEVSPAQRETRDGQEIFVVTVTLTQPLAQQYLERTMEIQGISQENQDEAIAHLDAWFADQAELPVTLWIDQSSFYLRRAEVPFAMTLQPRQELQQQGVLLPPTDLVQAIPQELRLQGRAILSLDAFNQEFSVDAPSDPESLQNIQLQLEAPGSE